MNFDDIEIGECFKFANNDRESYKKISPFKAMLIKFTTSYLEGHCYSRDAFMIHNLEKTDNIAMSLNDITRKILK